MSLFICGFISVWCTILTACQIQPNFCVGEVNSSIVLLQPLISLSELSHSQYFLHACYNFHNSNYFYLFSWIFLWLDPLLGLQSRSWITIYVIVLMVDKYFSYHLLLSMHPEYSTYKCAKCTGSLIFSTSPLVKNCPLEAYPSNSRPVELPQWKAKWSTRKCNNDKFLRWDGWVFVENTKNLDHTFTCGSKI